MLHETVVSVVVYCIVSAEVGAEGGCVRPVNNFNAFPML